MDTDLYLKALEDIRKEIHNMAIDRRELNYESINNILISLEDTYNKGNKNS